MNYRLVYFLCGPANAPGMENEPQAYHHLKKSGYVSTVRVHECKKSLMEKVHATEQITNKFEIKGLVMSYSTIHI